MFTTGDNPHGCGHAPRTVFKGDRTTAADYLVGLGSNLAIKTNTTVDKVVIENDGQGLKATGVQIVSKDGQKSTVKARKEIIVSGGAYCSPTILMRSGIGSKEELKQHGIECKVDLPGVGKNLQDHLVRKTSPCSMNTSNTDIADRLHILRNRKGWSHKRLPPLPRRRPR